MARLADARTMMTACMDLVRGGHKIPGRRWDDSGDAGSDRTMVSLPATCRRNQSGNILPGIGQDRQNSQARQKGVSRDHCSERARSRCRPRRGRILQPVVEPKFSPFSFGCRPKRSSMAALAIALALAQSENRRVWIADDVAKAFDLFRLAVSCSRVMCTFRMTWWAS